jgi:hypothetical protein
MEELLQCQALRLEILHATVTQVAADTLISKWAARGHDLGPAPLDTAAALEARSRVYGWETA